MKANPETVKRWKKMNAKRVSLHNKVYYKKHRERIGNERIKKKLILNVEWI